MVTLREILDGLKDEYLSDLNINDIPDDEVSDVNEEDINLEHVPLSESNSELHNKIKV